VNCFPSHVDLMLIEAAFGLGPMGYRIEKK